MSFVDRSPAARVAKLPCDAHAYRRPARAYATARAAFQAFLAHVVGDGPGRVLLPAFIGWSPREGSGVFDPVRALGLRYNFYRVDERLDVDLDHLGEQLARGDVGVLVLIHYFGRPDPRAAVAAQLAREHGVVVIEDEAHALYTDLVGGGAGRLGDACVYSFHKMLPVAAGGALVVNPGADPRVRGLAAAPGDAGTSADVWHDLWQHDLAAIAGRRRANAAAVADAVAALAGRIEPLWGQMPASTVLQTFPVRVREVSRDGLYHTMNAAGYGVVSLYHTLIAEISPAEFPASHALARSILNLPVHQDATPAQLYALAAELGTQHAAAAGARQAA